MQWKAKVVIGDLHSAYQSGNLTINEVASKLADRLKKLAYYENDSEFDEIVDGFEDIAENEYADVNDYDSVLSDLYNWADSQKRLWVDSFEGRVA